VALLGLARTPEGIDVVSRRKPGLFLPPTRVEVQDVNKRMSRPCSVCGAAIPGGRRLVVAVGSARSARAYVLCPRDGDAYLERMSIEAQRARIHLRGDRLDGDGIRLSGSALDPAGA